tara:strand:- start:207 stop:4100 length:3894 start_codon:yes stop_codon:yes gene_type:complete
MADDVVLDLAKPRLFAPSIVRTVISKPGGVKGTSLKSVAARNIGHTASFRYDGPQDGIKSTQQLGLDFSKFENHTFFNSAQSKVNVAFDRVINHFPFDGTRKEIESFMDTLTGFENYVFQKIPKYKGYLNFVGTDAASGGNYIIIKDAAGSRFPDFSKNDTGDKKLDPGVSSFTIDMHVFIPMQQTTASVICQMLGKSNGSAGSPVNDRGFTLGFKNDSFAETETSSSIFFAAISGSDSIFTSASLDKGKFNRVVATYNRKDFFPGRLQIFINKELVSQSKQFDLGDFRFHASTMTIGSGSSQKKILNEGLSAFTPQATFSGSIDELRFFHSVRDITQQKADNTTNIYPMDQLKLYYKFNEPTGSHSLGSVVLDSSGNSLHSEVMNYTNTLRLTGTLVDPLSDEDVNVSPVLFPGYFEVRNLISELLTSGSNYDTENPNIITKLIPNHYLQAGMEQEGLPAEDTGITQPFSGNSIPGSGKITSSQIIVSFLLVWAKFFDEIKMFIDEFANLTFIDYDSDVSVSDQFLYFVGKYYGIDLPRIFADPSISQYVDGTNLKVDLSRSSSSLHFVQSAIWRRILTNLPHIVRSKGTVEGIKALIRTLGIHPENNFRILEYGGPVKRQIFDRTERRSEISTLIDFSGSLALKVPTALTAQGFSNNRPYITSSFLSGARIEPGRPEVAPARFINPIGNAYSYPPSAPYNRLKDIDAGEVHNGKLPRTGRSPMAGGWRGPGFQKYSSMGMFTSGSWTYEAIYKMPTRTTGVYSATQSLARIYTTGSREPATMGALLLNLVAFSGSSPRITLFGKVSGERPPASGDPVLSKPIILTLTGVNIFDGNKWNISFGRERSDLATPKLENVGIGIENSRYFLRAARPKYSGGVLDYNVTASIFSSSKAPSSFSSNAKFNFLEHGGYGVAENPGTLSKGNNFNASGSFIVIGSQSLYLNNSVAKLRGNRFLNRSDYDNHTTTTDFGDMCGNKETRFEGMVGHMRWWSKFLTQKEWRTHVVNFKSLGVEKPLSNFNFSLWESGSWERLRLDVTSDQIVTQSNASGEIELTDFSQNKKDPVLFASGVQLGLGGPKIERWGNYSFSGKGFESNIQVIKPERFHFAILSSKWDLRESDNKIRVRGYQDPEKIRFNEYADKAPVYEIQPWLEPDDDLRFSIEFSSVKALDEDIMSLFQDLGFFNDAIGDPTYLYSDFYPDIEQMRKIYFNRLTKRIDFKLLFDFFKWFDTTFSAIIEQLIPRKVNFLGVNYVVESHALERPKMRYLQDEIYLKYKDRDIIDASRGSDTFVITGIVE